MSEFYSDAQPYPKTVTVISEIETYTHEEFVLLLKSLKNRYQRIVFTYLDLNDLILSQKEINCSSINALFERYRFIYDLATLKLTLALADLDIKQIFNLPNSARKQVIVEDPFSILESERNWVEGVKSSVLVTQTFRNLDERTMVEKTLITYSEGNLKLAYKLQTLQSDVVGVGYVPRSIFNRAVTINVGDFLHLCLSLNEFSFDIFKHFVFRCRKIVTLTDYFALDAFSYLSQCDPSLLLLLLPHNGNFGWRKDYSPPMELLERFLILTNFFNPHLKKRSLMWIYTKIEKLRKLDKIKDFILSELIRLNSVQFEPFGLFPIEFRPEYVS